MLLDLPSLNQSCEQFCKRAGTEIMQRRALNHLVLEHHSELLDLLEIPELMDTYVRGEFYDEALQLESFTQTLKKKHPDITIIQSIVISPLATKFLPPKTNSSFQCRWTMYVDRPNWCFHNSIQNSEITFNYPFVCALSLIFDDYESTAKHSCVLGILHASLFILYLY